MSDATAHVPARTVPLELLGWIAALICGVTPLWAARSLPLVDLGQHLHLIDVLHRLGDPTTLYPEVFEQRGVLTPYLGYYYLVSGLSWLMPLELANRLVLTLYVAGLPVSLAFVLASFKRPTWPALLSLPFAYGDSFAWGFLNYCTALPLALFTCGAFVRAIEETARRRRWSVLLALSLAGVLLFHVQVFAWLGVALPLLLVTTSAPGETWLRARWRALLGVVPGVALFIAWVGLRLGQPQEIAPGQPWRSWGPMLSAENLGWKGFEQNRDELVSVLANMLPDGSDQRSVTLALGAAALVGLATLIISGARQSRVLAAAAAVLALYWLVPAVSTPGSFALTSMLIGGRSVLLGLAVLAGVAWLGLRGTLEERVSVGAGALVAVALDTLGQGFPLSPVNRLCFAHVATLVGLWAASRWAPPERQAEVAATVAGWRIVGLTVAAVWLFFALPFDIRGYMYYLNTRYAHLAAALAVCCVPVLAVRWSRPLVALGVAVAVFTALPLAKGFRAYDAEAQALERIALAAGEKPRVMGLLFATGSAHATHPVYLHAATAVARARGGLTNFSFALTAHSPLKYRGEPPPTFPSEWRPDQMTWEAHGRHYDHFLVRGAHPSQISGARLGSELFIAAHEGDLFLVRRR